MADPDTRPLLDALSCPIGDLIAAVGRGVADAQRALDEASLATLSEVYSRHDGLLGELQRIGYRPNWYHIPEVESELQIALTISGGPGRGAQAGAAPAGRVPRLKLYAAPVDAGYSSRFNFQLQATSRVKFKVVSVPASNAADAIQAMPLLSGLSLGEARARLTLLGITASLPEGGPDDALVRSQEPAAGSLLNSASSVRVGIT